MEFNKIGTIKEGKFTNWKITILNDVQDTGGYYVLIWDNDNEGFDDWFENFEQMERFIKKEYKINWSDQKYK